VGEAAEGGGSVCLAILINWNWELLVFVVWIWHWQKIWFSEEVDIEFERRFPYQHVFPEGLTHMTLCLETVFAVEGGTFMVYEPPVVQYQGALSDILRGLFPVPRKERRGMDRRIVKLLQFIDSHEGRIGWDIDHACQELRLDISGAHAARLFKRHTGLGVREYARKKRLLMAAQRLKTTDLSVKAIAAEFGYKRPFDFSRVFKKEFRLSPIAFRRERAA